MNRTTLLLTCLLAITPVHAESTRTIKAAAIVSSSLAIYIDLQYSGPEPSAGNNLVVSGGRALVLHRVGPGQVEQLDMACRHDPVTIEEFQPRPTGRGGEGMVVSVLCEDKAAFSFLLVDGVARTLNRHHDLPCENGILKTRGVASAVSFGHQAFCLEDWSSVPDPKARLSEAFEQRQRQ